MMKKLICLSMFVVSMAILVGCGGGLEDAPVVERIDWGITLTASDVTPTGLIIVCEQAGGTLEGNLQTGSDYWLEVYEKDTWQRVPNLLEDSASLSWTAEAWHIAHDGTTQWSIDWEWLYGELSTGTYRIGKSISDSVEGLISEKQSYYATFVIE